MAMDGIGGGMNVPPPPKNKGAPAGDAVDKGGAGEAFALPDEGSMDMAPVDSAAGGDMESAPEGEFGSLMDAIDTEGGGEAFVGEDGLGSQIDVMA